MKKPETDQLLHFRSLLALLSLIHEDEYYWTLFGMPILSFTLWKVSGCSPARMTSDGWRNSINGWRSTLKPMGLSEAHMGSDGAFILVTINSNGRSRNSRGILPLGASFLVCGIKLTILSVRQSKRRIYLATRISTSELRKISSIYRSVTGRTI